MLLKYQKFPRDHIFCDIKMNDYGLFLRSFVKVTTNKTKTS